MANKFQTGFDQKKLVALYVDKPLGNAIEIVQTYSRVNRTCSGKDRVFVVDFVNDPETVLAAFKTYDKGATMSAAQDPNVVYDLKDALDAADVFATRDVEGFKEALYRSKGLAAGGESDAYRTALYSAVSGPAEIFRERFAAARDSYETWLECANRAEAAGEAEEAERAKRSADEACGTRRRADDLQEEALQVLLRLHVPVPGARLRRPRPRGVLQLRKAAPASGSRAPRSTTSTCAASCSGTSAYRPRRSPRGSRAASSCRWARAAQAPAPKRDTMARIVES